MDIIQFPMFEDNYGYLLRADGKTAAVDPGDAPRVIRELETRGWRLDEIWNTHHHWDHAGGNEALRKEYGCKVLAPAREKDKIGLVDRALEDGDTVNLGTSCARVLDFGGHTLGHIAYWFDAERALFCGDTVFGLGCGRLFEGTPAQMWSSLSKILKLPDDTRLYCAHEYLMANASFAANADPENDETRRRIEESARLRAGGQPTVPMELGLERRTNPFFRPANGAYLQKYFPGKEPVEAFAALREKRNHWKS